MIGTCKLCLTPGVDLQDSHFIPAGIYRQLRETGQGNPNPVTITEEASFQSSRQMKAHLLCSACEDRISKRGEDWVLKHFLRADGTFRLADLLAAEVPAAMADGQQTKVYFTKGVSGVNVDAITNFASSIFWRGSIHPWNHDASVPVPLGPFAEQFRRYLMAESDFPRHAALFVTVRDGGEVSRLTSTPVGKRHGQFRIYKFPMPGLAFALAVGQGIPDRYRAYCFYRGERNPISVTPLLEDIIQQDAIRYLLGHKTRIRNKR
jgi:hypothetical protein